LWATNVSDPNAPTLKETAGIAINNVKKAVPYVKKAAHAGFHGAKTGIRAVGGLADEFEKTPMARNMMTQAEADMHHMKSAGRRARGSIATTSLGNKRHMTASSLIKQHNLVMNKTTFTNAGSNETNPYGITARYERGNGERVELHYYHRGQRLTHAQVAQVLTQKQIHQLKQGAKYSILGHKIITASGLITRNHGGLGDNPKSITPVLNKPRFATTSGLVHRHHSGVV
jgi:hypothetical protein